MNSVHNIKTLDPLHDGDRLLGLLADGGQIPLLVTGSSMLPFLRSGRDTVLLRKYTGRPRRGQILFFRRADGSFVLHRLRKIRSDGLLVMNGDAQTFCEIIRPEQAAAAVISLTRGGRTYSADSVRMRLLTTLWYPTRPFRPLIFRLYGSLRSLLRPAR